MGLADYLIMPIQRVTRYGLLLKGTVVFQGNRSICRNHFRETLLLMPERPLPFLFTDLKKHTSVENPDYDDLDGAIKIINGLAIAMNHAQKKN
jgi:RhoGEF domain